MKQLERYVEKITPVHEESMLEAKAHWDQIAKPLDGLGLLEKEIIKIAGVQGTPKIQIDKKCVLVMCADNGVVAQGVSQTGQEVTKIVSENIAMGQANVNLMAQVAQMDVRAIDIGIAKDSQCNQLIQRKVAYGTKNLAQEDAMTLQEVEKAILVGINEVEYLYQQGYQLIATGEMGIGNTTTSSALSSVLLHLPVEEVTGKGAGLDIAGIERKRLAIEQGILRHRGQELTIYQLLASLGGLDICGLVGVYLGGARYGIPIVMDGLIANVAALCAYKIAPLVAQVLIPSHQSEEPASQMIMKELGVEPIIHGHLALGEGTGAVLLCPMLDMALAIYNSNRTFSEIAVEKYERY